MNLSILKMVVIIIGLVVIITLVLSGMLLMQDKNLPDLFGTVIVASITGLLGLLAPSKEATTPTR